MRTLLSLAATAGLTLGLVAGSVAAAKPAKPAKAAAKKCQACGMTLSTKKTKDMPQMVKIGGKTYYCCKACDMSKKKEGEKPKEKAPG